MRDVIGGPIETSRCDLLERRVAELEQMSTWLQQQLAHAWHVLNERTQLLLEESVNDCPGGTFVCVKCWSWSAAHQSCDCGKNQRYIDQPGMHRSGANGPSAGDPPLQCPDATRGAPLTAEQGTSATISPPVGHGAQGEPATGQSSIRSPHETADGGLFHPYDDIPVPHGDVQPGDRCVVYTGGSPCIKPGTVVDRVGERWRVQLDRASTLLVGEEEMVLVPMEWVP